jgi:hypothetical protein
MPATKRWRLTVVLAMALGAALAVILPQLLSHARSSVPVRMSAASDSTATRQGHAASEPGQTSAKPSQAAGQGQAAAFTTCVREHGVSDFPGIAITANGSVQLNSGGSFDPMAATYKAAARACASYLPNGSSLPAEPNPPKPAAPTVGFQCSGHCPTPPKASGVPF